MQDNFEYWLPGENGEQQKYKTSHNSVVIIGANGSGKSKLGAWIERQNLEQVHRIGAQRKLNFQENITLKSSSAAENEVFYGNQDPKQSRNKYQRWGVQESEYTTRLIDDFEPVLAALLAQQNNQQADYTSQCREAERDDKPKPNVPKMVIDELQKVWCTVFPQRDISVEDSKFYATLQRDNDVVKYSANQMSDGERSVLYLAAQVLCMPRNKILIIDEPELHLHRSIMHPLWVELEKCRPDCLFIYITHDTVFAAIHNMSNKLWIREFDGKNWKLEAIENSDLPEDLLLEILGSRKDVIFVEGEKGGYDARLYGLLYPDYYIIPCGGCEQVISRVRSFKRSPQLHHCNVYGIIDRDYKSDTELLAYQSDNVFAIEAAEVENLFLTDEVLNNLANYLKLNEKVVQKAKDQVITRLSQRKSEQARLQTIAIIKHKLSTADVSGVDGREIGSKLNKLLSGMDYSAIYEEELSQYEELITNKDYRKIIKLFNDKRLLNEIGHFFGLQNNDFVDCVLRLLENDACEGLRKAFLGYMPKQIPTTVTSS